MFHISTPLGFEPGSLMTGSKRVDHWTSGTVYECREIAGSPQYTNTVHMFGKIGIWSTLGNQVCMSMPNKRAY
jgi:hypothetical protein